MKKLLLLSTAAIALTVASVANAETYVAARAGYGFTKTDVNRGKMDDYVPVLGAAFGYITPYDNFRGEFEYNYRFEADDKVKQAKAKFSAHTMMFNGYYDFKNSSKFTPYVGAGIGVAYWDEDTKLNGVKLRDKDGWDFAASALGGVSYAITKSIDADLTLKYTYINTSDGSHNIDGMLGLRYKF